MLVDNNAKVSQITGIEIRPLSIGIRNIYGYPTRREARAKLVDDLFHQTVLHASREPSINARTDGQRDALHITYLQVFAGRASGRPLEKPGVVGKYPMLGYSSQPCNLQLMSRSFQNDAHKLFRAMLKELRREKGITQDLLADLLDMPQSYVSKYELGERRVDLVETFEICRALDADFVAFARQFVRNVESKGSGRVTAPNDRHKRR